MLTQAQLKEEVWYDFLTGKMFWLKYRSGRNMNCELGTVHKSIKSNTIYLRVEIFGERYFIHNLVWLYVFGEFPSSILDHKDKNGKHNRVHNLRLATASQNKFNSSLYRNNTSGHHGIYLQNGKWRAELRHEGRKISLGMWDTIEQALVIRNAKAKELYGDFA